MQRSFGKKILAVVAGVGMAAAGLVSVAPAANADDHGYYEYKSIASGKLFETSPAYTACGVATSTKSENSAEVKAGKLCEQRGYTGAVFIFDTTSTWVEGDKGDELEEIVEDVVEPAPAPPPCWSTNNCPVGGAIQVAVPQYMMVGVPQTLTVYAAWTPDPNSPAQPSNGDAVISMDGEPVAAAPFADGVATFKFTPAKAGLKNVTVSGVLNSNTSGANAWVDSVPGSTMVLPYDPALLEEALKNKKVEVGDTYTLEEIAQAKTALGKRLEWRVAQGSKDVCSVVSTKKGEVRAKFTESGKCSIIWTDPKKDEEGKYTFIAKK